MDVDDEEGLEPAKRDGKRKEKKERREEKKGTEER